MAQDRQVSVKNDRYLKMKYFYLMSCDITGFYIRRPGGLFPAPMPQESHACERASKLFWFLGVFLAKVLQDGRLVDLPLSRALLKLMCGGDARFRDDGAATPGAAAASDVMTSSLISDDSDKELELDPPKPAQVRKLKLFQ